MNYELLDFVIHRHTLPGQEHYDLMLRAGSVLKTYRLALSPDQIAQGQTANAQRIADHDLRFLNYQGPVNQGRGNIEMAEHGTYEILDESPAFTTINFSGKILKGVYKLTLTAKDQYRIEFAK